MRATACRLGSFYGASQSGRIPDVESWLQQEDFQGQLAVLRARSYRKREVHGGAHGNMCKSNESIPRPDTRADLNTPHLAVEAHHWQLKLTIGNDLGVVEDANAGRMYLLQVLKSAPLPAIVHTPSHIIVRGSRRNYEMIFVGNLGFG